MKHIFVLLSSLSFYNPLQPSKHRKRERIPPSCNSLYTVKSVEYFYFKNFGYIYAFFTLEYKSIYKIISSALVLSWADISHFKEVNI